MNNNTQDCFDDHYRAVIKDLQTRLMQQQSKADKRKAAIIKMEEESAKRKVQYNLELNESKKCIDNLSAELGKIKRKLKRQGE